MKRAIFGFIVIWGLIGCFMFVFIKKDTNEEMPGQDDRNDTFHAQEIWILRDTENSTYEPPYWFTNEGSNAESVSHMEEHEIMPPHKQLMTFFAHIQLGEPTNLTSYLSPDKRDDDFESVSLSEIDKIDQILEEAAVRISKNKTISAVYISVPYNQKGDMVSEQPVPNLLFFNVLIKYVDDQYVLVKKVPMLYDEMSKFWGIDMTLTEFAAHLESFEKTE